MRINLLVLLVVGVMAGIFLGAAADPPEDAHAPHTPSLIYYLTGAIGAEDGVAIRAEIAKEKSASVVTLNAERGFVQVRFDSHVVSYHQIAQAIADAGKTLKKKYDPVLVFTVAGYATKAKELDTLFAGKRLNQRVRVTPLDKGRGIFLVHFLPLVVDGKDASPQGFNGGHLHHPVSDPVPRGLGLVSGYAETDDLTLFAGAASQAATQTGK